MPTEITLPRLGWSMEEGVFIEWLRRHGDLIKAGDGLFAIESDKAAQEVEAIDSGVLHIPATGPQKGDKIKVGAAIGYLLSEGESAEALTVLPVVTTPVAAKDCMSGAGDSCDSVSGDARGNPKELLETKAGLTPASPRARRVARENGVSLDGVHPSGNSGRIRERDVLKILNARGPEFADWHSIETQSLRRTIAERMSTSHQNTVPVTIHRRCDAVKLVDLRNQFKAAAEDGQCPSFNDILIKIVAGALRRHPMLSARWVADNIELPKTVHIGFAVDTEHGLLVPVVRDVGRLSLYEIMKSSRALVSAARARELTSDQMKDGCFTITSLGSYGIEAFTPIINYPQTAILGVGAIKREAVAMEDGSIANRHQMTLSLTFDHRIVDGAPAARFLQLVSESIENPFVALLNSH